MIDVYIVIYGGVVILSIVCIYTTVRCMCKKYGRSRKDEQPNNNNNNISIDHVNHTHASQSYASDQSYFPDEGHDIVYITLSSMLFDHYIKQKVYTRHISNKYDIHMYTYIITQMHHMSRRVRDRVCHQKDNHMQPYIPRRVHTRVDETH